MNQIYPLAVALAISPKTDAGRATGSEKTGSVSNDLMIFLLHILVECPGDIARLTCAQQSCSCLKQIRE